MRAIVIIIICACGPLAPGPVESTSAGTGTGATTHTPGSTGPGGSGIVDETSGSSSTTGGTSSTIASSTTEVQLDCELLPNFEACICNGEPADPAICGCTIVREQCVCLTPEPINAPPSACLPPASSET